MKKTRLSSVLQKLQISTSASIQKMIDKINSGKKISLPELQETIWKDGDKYYIHSKFTDDVEELETEGELEQYLDSALY